MESQEYITIKMTREVFDSVIDILPPHEVKEVRIKDDLFLNDEVHKELKSLSDKAYKRLQVYEWDKRNK